MIGRLASSVIRVRGHRLALQSRSSVNIHPFNKTYSRLTTSNSCNTMDKVLLDNSTSRFFIEYGGFLSNHMSHGIIALHRLGATTERLEKFAGWYSNKLDSSDSYPEEKVAAEGEELTGKRKSFYELVKRYEKRLNEEFDGDLDALIREVFPSFSRGMIGSALHGLIHTGYGYAARSNRVVCEGMAYLEFSYLPLTLSDQAPSLSTLGEGSMEILDVINLFGADDELHSFMMEAAEREDAAVKSHGKYQPRVAALFLHRGDRLAEYAQQIKFPVSMTSELSQKQLTSFLKWVVDCSIIAYLVAARRNDFFLLHGVTSAWCLYNILPLLRERPEHIRECVRTYLCVLLATYAAVERPALCLEHLKQPVTLSWNEIRAKAIKSEYDEHLYKMVQVCWEMSQANQDAEMETVYRLAAISAVSNELAFTKGVTRK